MKEAVGSLVVAVAQAAILIAGATALARGLYEYVPFVWGLFG